MENGLKRVMLTDLDQAVIDRTVPLKIMVTPSGETNGVYVAERSYDSFLVKENDNGQSNAEFDWTVIAKVLSPEAAVPPAVDADDTSPADNNPVTEPTSTPPIPIESGQTSTPPLSPDNTSPVVDQPVAPPENTISEPLAETQPQTESPPIEQPPAAAPVEVPAEPAQ